jgi:hypothetical protein
MDIPAVAAAVESGANGPAVTTRSYWLKDTESCLSAADVIPSLYI